MDLQVRGLQSPKCIICNWYSRLFAITVLNIIAFYLTIIPCQNWFKKKFFLLTYALLFFRVSLYMLSFGNVHFFSKQNILLSIRVMYINFIMHNNHVKTDFKEFLSKDRNALRYFCASLYMRYWGNVRQNYATDFA